jgi:hypothetical protein
MFSNTINVQSHRLHTLKITITTAHNFFSGFTSRCLVAASHGGRSPASGFPNCCWIQQPSSRFSQIQLLTDSITTQIKIMLRSKVSRPEYFGVKLQSWAQNQFLLLSDPAGLLICGALSNERTGLSIRVTAGLYQCSNSRVRVPRDPLPYFTVSDSRIL